MYKVSENLGKFNLLMSMNFTHYLDILQNPMVAHLWFGNTTKSKEHGQVRDEYKYMFQICLGFANYRLQQEMEDMYCIE